MPGQIAHVEIPADDTAASYAEFSQGANRAPGQAGVQGGD
jgi:hypothetical protein